MAFKLAAGSDDPRAGLWQFTGAITRRTDKAVLFVTSGGAWKAWLPRKKIIIDETQAGVEVSMPEWLAREKGLL